MPHRMCEEIPRADSAGSARRQRVAAGGCRRPPGHAQRDLGLTLGQVRRQHEDAGRIPAAPSTEERVLWSEVPPVLR